MGARIRAHDWAATPIGSPETWPQSLRSAVSILLPSKAQIVLFWGPELIAIYNDAYAPAFGSKHPWALGRPARECWSEVWHVIGPLFENVTRTGEAFWAKDHPFVLNREGFLEETYFDVSYDPVRVEDGAVGGVFCIVSDQTGRVLGERRLRTLRELGSRTAEVKSAAEVCVQAAAALASDPADIPFSLLYLRNNGGIGEPAAMGGVDCNCLSAKAHHLDIKQVLKFAHDDQTAEIDVSLLLTQPPQSAAERALVLPISSGTRTVGVMIAGVSRFLRLAGDYRDFFKLASASISAAIDQAHAYEEEKRRAEALAEIDRAKTTFFSNVSHEFRTPLTLMMGPLEDTLNQSETLTAADRDRLELARRNSLRLLKLVNTLLDFPRIEAGRIEASYEPTDLATLTMELASVFRSAIERAGMTLIVDCPSLAEPVYVDREMWEKIVLNLLSNAFKFTFEGEIEVSLRSVDSVVEMTVRDTGTGISATEIPRLFERFHRVAGARGRSFEGSGIGLALVQELVKLHGGHVRVESELNRGSRFVVSIPTGKAHLPADRIQAGRTLASTALRASAYLEEALRWAPGTPQTPVADSSEGAEPLRVLNADSTSDMPAPSELSGARIVFADDNSDMREYVRRLLSGYDVEVVPDGMTALRAARARRPDLVLTDVMMPVMDGMELLCELRADPYLREVPIILLSARAGEEARIEGMQAGADDYLIKPFGARELLARVESHIKMARLRMEAADALRHRTAQFETLFNRAPLGVFLVDTNLRIREVNPIALPEFRHVPGGIIGRDFEEIVHVIWEQEYADEILAVFRRTLITGEPYVASEWSGLRADRGVMEYYEWRLDRIVLPDGQYGLVCYFRDISQQVQADATRQLLLKELNHRVKNTLATVQAIAQQTLRRTKEPAEFTTRFSGRIQSLARVHSLLTETNWQGADLQELIRDQLLQGPVDETRLTAWGPAVRLGSQMAVHVALMLHELGTNSAKYGALAAAGGWVTVSWSVKEDQLHLRWAERGGQSVKGPINRGFGMTLIEQSARSEGGNAQMLCEAEGITWEITLPLPPVSVPTSMVTKTEPMLVNSVTSNLEPATPNGNTFLSGRRILVVEDEPMIALDFADTLEKLGAEVIGPVGTEREAMETVQERAFDCALLDANLHGRSVDEIAAALTKRNIPFIFVTGYGGAGLHTSFRHAPVLAKPVSEQQLLDAIRGMAMGDQNVALVGVHMRH